MRKRVGLWVCIWSFVLGAATVTAGELTLPLSFTADDLIFKGSGEYDQVYLRDGGLTDRVGWPQIPYTTVHLALPPGGQIDSVTVDTPSPFRLPGEFSLFPCQPPQVLSKDPTTITFRQPDPVAYRSAEEYPAQFAQPAGGGGYAGYQLGAVKVYPVHYIAADSAILLYQSLDVHVHYTLGDQTPIAAKSVPKKFVSPLHTVVQSLVHNPDQATTEPAAPSFRKTTLDPKDVEYLIVTTEYLESALQPLADWKTAKGVPAEIVTLEWVYANYAGADAADILRNFLKDAYQEWGVRWLLLGGDTYYVPHRTAWAMDVEYGGSYDENELPTDWYFADLDGTWDANQNGIYGEVGDNVDLYPELIIGRAPCDSRYEMNNWVAKVLQYEQNPPTDYQLNMAFYAEVLWGNPYTDGGIAKNYIEDLYIPDRFAPIEKLYQSLGNETQSAVIQSLNNGQNIVNHNGHCWIDYMSTGSGGLVGWDMDNLYNGSRQTAFLFSIGCWPAAFDYDCVAEHFVTNPNGGGVAFIGNSRYGWGSPGNSEYGYSDRLDQQMFKALLADSMPQLGAAFTKARSVYVPHARQENVYRWCIYECNLLGDPEMPVWTDTPRQIVVDHPDNIQFGSTEYTFTVTDNTTKQPLVDALVCVQQGSDVYERGLTDERGQVRLTLDPAPSGTMTLTVTNHNYLMYQTYLDVGGSGTSLHLTEVTIDDVAGGNGDGVPSPGEACDLYLSLQNSGTNTAPGVTGSISLAANPYVSLISSSLSFGDIAAGATVTSQTPCQMTIAADCPPGYNVNFDWVVTESGGTPHAGSSTIHIQSSLVAYYRYHVDDAAGNGNGIADPGETLTVRLWLKNTGSVTAMGVSVLPNTADPYLSLPTDPQPVGTLAPDEIGYAEFTTSIDPSTPIPRFPLIEMTITSDNGSDDIDSVLFSIGPHGIGEDFESGSPGWTHGGTRDYWHECSHRVLNGTTAWYSGIEDDWYYQGSTRSWLESPEIVVGPDAQLTFWDWFSVPNYGVDGLHVIVTVAGSNNPDTLDFIGTGGALDSALITGNSWTKEEYDLSGYAPGTRVKARFAFSSDNDADEDEGFYIDDVRLESTPDYDLNVNPTRILQRGGAAETVTSRIHVHNTGFWEDTFSLEVFDNWLPTAIWDASGSAELTEISSVAPGEVVTLLVQVNIPSGTPAMIDSARIRFTSENDPSRSAQACVVTTSEGGAASAPWRESFAGGPISPPQWPMSEWAEISDGGLYAPTPPEVAELEHIGYLLSQRIDLSQLTDGQLAFWYRGINTGWGGWSGPSDLNTQYLNDAGQWKVLSYISGSSGESSVYREKILSLPNDALHDAFRVRFNATGNMSGKWLLDDIYIGPRRDYHVTCTFDYMPIYGVSGDPIPHDLQIFNRGSEPDSYLLETVSGVWPIRFLDNGQEISETDVIDPAQSITIEVEVTIPETALVNDLDTTLVAITSVGDAVECRQAVYQTSCLGGVADIPWCDSIASSVLSDEKWPLRSGVQVGSDPYAPAGSWTMVAGGSDTAYSQFIDLSEVDEAMLDFYARAGGSFIMPGPDERITIAYRATDGSWHDLTTLSGGGRYRSQFDRHCMSLPVDALGDRFQFRIGCDCETRWYFDDFKIVLTPHCEITSDVLDFTLNPGTEQTAQIYLDNTGSGTLEYRISVIPAAVTMSALLARMIKATDHDPLSAALRTPAETFACDWGGPGAGGYLWIDSDEPYAPAFEFVDIAGIGEPLARLDTKFYDTAHLGFEFPYYGEVYTEVLVSAYGYLQFGDQPLLSSWMALPIPHSISPNNVLFWCYGDYETLGDVYAYSDDSTAILQLNGFGQEGSSWYQATAQVELRANGRIAYRFLEFGDGFVTKECGVGIEGPTGNEGHGIVFYVNPVQNDPQYLRDSLQIIFYPPPDWISLDYPVGTVAPQTLRSVSVDFITDELPPGDYDAILRFDLNDPDAAANPWFVNSRVTVLDTSSCYCPMGDLNLDEAIDPLDVVYLVNFVYRQAPEPPWHPKCPYHPGDVHPDGVVDPLDVTCLVNYVFRGLGPLDNPCGW